MNFKELSLNMKLAKSCKIFLFIISLLAICLSSVGLLSAKEQPVYAAEPSVAFGTNNAKLEYKGDNVNGDAYLQAVLNANDAEIKIRNQLAINDFELLAAGLDADSNISKIEVTLEYESLYVNGVAKNYEADDVTLDKTIQSVLVIDVKKETIKLNDSAETPVTFSGGLSIRFSTNKNNITATVEDAVIAEDDEYYKIAGKDKNVANLTLKFILDEVERSGLFKMLHIHQKVSDGDNSAYRQTFVRDTNGEIATYAKPVISLGDDVWNVKNEDNGDEKYEIQVVYANKYNFSMKAFSVFGNLSSANLYLTAEDKEDEAGCQQNNGTIVLENSDKPKYARFYSDNENEPELTVLTLGVAGKPDGSTEEIPCETFNIRVVKNAKIEGNNKEPEYECSESALKSFKIELDKVVENVRLGDKITIPSMKDLIKDDFTPYSKLTHTVYYKTPSNESGSTSGWTIEISEAGDYIFYVVFKDEQGGEIDVEKFFTFNDKDDNEVDEGDYYAYVFSFKVNDDEPFEVMEAESVNKVSGFVGVEYKIKPFDVKGYDYTQNYTLYYNPNVDATEDDDGWILVEVGDNYTQEEIDKIDYDGQRTFTPDKMGAYMIECTAVSNNETKSGVARAIIKIENEPIKVKRVNTWFREHLAPMIFLMVGSVCLIVLIVLIFIKPKQPTIVKEETSEKKK